MLFFPGQLTGSARRASPPATPPRTRPRPCSCGFCAAPAAQALPAFRPYAETSSGRSSRPRREQVLEHTCAVRTRIRDRPVEPETALHEEQDTHGAPACSQTVQSPHRRDARCRSSAAQRRRTKPWTWPSDQLFVRHGRTGGRLHSAARCVPCAPSGHQAQALQQAGG